MEENVVMTMEDEVLVNQNEELQEDNDFEETTDMTIPEDIQEAQERCMTQPIVALVVGGVAVGAAIGVGINKLVKTIKRKKAERAEAKEAAENTEEETDVEDEAEEVDEHPEVPSEEAKNLLRPESQRKRTNRKQRRKKVG